MKCKVVGVQHVKGAYKKSGQPFDADILHVVNVNNIRGEALGCACSQVWIDRYTGLLPTWPEIGTTVDVGYDNRGRLEYVDILE